MDTKLSSSAVNSGVPVSLGVTSINYAHKNNIRSPQIPSKFTTSDAITETDFVGWENPKIVIQGVFKDKQPVTNGATITLMKSFAKNTTSTYILDDFFFPSYTKLQIESVTFDRKATDGIYQSGSTTYKGAVITYSINGTLSI